MLIAGVVGFNPVAVHRDGGCLASAGWSLYLLYNRIPAVMHVRGSRPSSSRARWWRCAWLSLMGMMGAGV